MGNRSNPDAIPLGWWLLLLIVSISMMGLTLGSEGWALGGFWEDRQLVIDIRLPRTLGAFLAGGLLGLAGALAQGLFRNPLADPYLLGSASGAGLGVAIGLIFLTGTSLAPWVLRVGVTGMAFLGAWGAVVVTLILAWGVQHTLRLLLAGVVVGVVLGACASLLVLLYPKVQGSVQAFMLGSTSFVGWHGCILMAGTLALCLTVSWLTSPVLDGLALGESTAQSLGLPVTSVRLVLVATMALCTAAAVAQTGLIAFVGLAAPHLVRSQVKAVHARTLCLSCGMGAAILGGADLLARALIAPLELPVGVLTSILGGGYMLILMRRLSKGDRSS
jgi:iron complex transport system permease protein